MRNWQPISLAPVGEEIWTKIDDEHGERNVQRMTAVAIFGGLEKCTFTTHLRIGVGHDACSCNGICDCPSSTGECRITRRLPNGKFVNGRGEEL